MKLFSKLICSIIFFRICSQAYVSAQVTLGVKEGDWIENNHEYSGSTPSKYYIAFEGKKTIW